MSEVSLTFGWVGFIFMLVFGIVLVVICYLDSQGRMIINKTYLYLFMGAVVAVAVWFIFSKTINLFF